MNNTKKEVDHSIKELLKDCNMHMGYQFVFPQYNILPDEVQLALKVLKNHGMKILFVLEDNPEK